MPKSSLCIVFIFYFTLSILSYIVFYCILIPNNFSISFYFLPLIYLSGGFPLNSTLLLNRPCLFLISRREKEESSIYLSQVFNINLCTVWPHIDCPFTLLVWLASEQNVCRHLTSCNPTDPSNSKHWQASRRLAIRPGGFDQSCGS